MLQRTLSLSITQNHLRQMLQRTLCSSITQNHLRQMLQRTLCSSITQNHLGPGQSSKCYTEPLVETGVRRRGQVYLPEDL